MVFTHLDFINNSNDCSAKSRVSFHFVGHKCNLCGSYNTVMCDILKPPEQTPTVTSSTNTTDLVSAGAEATASVAAIMDTQTPFVEPSPLSDVSESTGRRTPEEGGQEGV
jgi:hypothetical protein